MKAPPAWLEAALSALFVPSQPPPSLRHSHVFCGLQTMKSGKTLKNPLGANVTKAASPARPETAPPAPWPSSPSPMSLARAAAPAPWPRPLPASTGQPAAPPPKRRRLPPSFDLHLHAAAKKIQRFWRWRRQLAQELDPILHEPIAPRELVELAEPNGSRHRFAAASLAAYFLKTACFCSPLSRRELFFWEVAKVLRRAPAGLRAPLLATWMARQALQRAAYERQGLDQAWELEETLDQLLQELLDVGEAYLFDFEPAAVQPELLRYRAMLASLHREGPEQARQLAARHAAVAERRGVFCPAALAAALRRTQAEACRQPRRGRPPELTAVSPPQPASSSLLLEVLRARLDFA